MKKIQLFFIITLCFIFFSSCNKDKKAFIVGKIQKASKLSTTEFTIEKIVHGTKTKKIAWFIKLNEARFLAYSKAIVKAGVDLNKISPKDIHIEGNSIYIELPSVEIINFSYPPKYFDIDELISDNAFLNRISIEDQESFFREAEINIRNNLEYMGIEKTTQEKTRIMLSGVLKSLGYESVSIQFKERKENLLLIPKILNQLERKK